MWRFYMVFSFITLFVIYYRMYQMSSVFLWKRVQFIFFLKQKNFGRVTSPRVDGGTPSR
jgi:hypothetical protein